ncbi:DUF4595 domain-containing protein [Bacteroides oleiciplenus]|uniref:DUF4595 domain-containing protein n=1 Tax=Bacteroides oleiciplenus YIT 12058 TaxID=742727 RepID=K9E072_9BACE|nr:DUF4595 domain-containing protein [Bacteroides oleiciplenus]EKU88961.1 hypothetical protein HMPREF9447_03835 [Bacteroides oleiciplenus YIT 12058]
MKKNIFAALLFIGALTACSDSDEGSGIPDEPKYPVTNFSKIELTEVKQEPNVPAVTVTQTYNYNATGRLTDFTIMQSFVAGGEQFKIENTTNVVYEDHKAIVTDEINNVSTYTLDDNGYAISCVRQETNGKIRSYTFDYLINTEGKYFLKTITETLNGNQPYSAINIDYSNFRALRITEQVDSYEQTYTASTSVGNEIANKSEIPFLFLVELYPLSLHTAAVYGKFLGDAYNTLITQLVPDGNSESQETTTYAYDFTQKGIDISYEETTKYYDDRGKVHTLTRTIDYIMENK